MFLQKGLSDNMNEFDQNVNLDNADWVKRVSTGVKGLDNLMSGGLPSNTITLVSGTPGSGKTILCFQFLWDGLQKNENCFVFNFR